MASLLNGRSRPARGRLIRRQVPNAVGECLEVLHDGREMEFITRAGETSETHALETVMGLEVGKAHLDSLPLVARFLEPRCIFE